MRKNALKHDARLSFASAGKDNIIMNKTICYCFDYTESDIRNDVLQNNGQSAILEKIVAEKQKGRCECPTRHPEDR